jgi:DNA-binding protein H-NS
MTTETTDELLAKIRELRQTEVKLHEHAEKLTLQALGNMRDARKKLYEANGAAAEIGSLVSQLKQRRAKPPAADVPPYLAMHRQRAQ